MRPQRPHSAAAQRAIAAELVRLTLGIRGPRRPELEAPILDDRSQHRRRAKGGRRGT